MTHLDRSALLEAAGGTPSPEAERHLAGCAACRRRVRTLRRRLETLEREASPAPSRTLERWALAVARNSRPSPVHRRTLARLETGGRPAVRGAAERAWLVGDAGCQLDIRAERTASGRFVLRGHLVRARGEAGGWRVGLEAAGGEPRRAFTDPWGEFAFDEVPPGPFRIVLDGDGERLETAGLELA